ncbi:hypothetical protein Trco_008461 [Trichoderma cornu-damae]|uniref:Uncharacterized protein n=1 Tax=Trichoderma cornu-damae TaxID=654480 RepID=A0A9P8QE24_9HYPO|nr:hypothetical protein Trco_008461 [Trichoderma cornu-damae]
MIFPIFTMPCLHHNHRQPPPILHSRDPYDEQTSPSTIIGLAVGLTLITAIIAIIIYYWCQRHRHRQHGHRRRGSESRHRREGHRQHADDAAAGNDARTAEMEPAAQRQGGGARVQGEPPLTAVPLSLHHHRHEDKHFFHGDHYHAHQHPHQNQHPHQEPGRRLDDNHGHDGEYQSRPHGSAHQHQHHRHRHHRFRRTQHVLFPRDPAAEFEKLLITPPSPRTIPIATRADLEAILNGLDIPLPSAPAPAQANGYADAAANNERETAARHGDEEQKEKRRKRHHHHRHRHHCRRRHGRVAVR